MPARLPGGVPDRVIVGLGNPGVRYAGTRHNVGFAVVHELVDRLKARPLERRDDYEAWQTDLAERSLAIVMPLRFMNLSGEALEVFRERHGAISPANCLVVVDDVYLPTGTLRLRAQGSDGGHNGLESVRLALGSAEFPRLRIGVGEPDDGSDVLADHVLSEFEPEELPLVRESIERACDAALLWAREGITAAMNQFNVRPRAERDNTPEGER